MRLLLVTWNFPPKVGGMETILSQLVQTLSTHVDVHVFGPYAAEELTTTAEQANIRRPRRNGLGWFVLDALVSGSRLLRSGDYDVIVAGSALVTPIAYTLGQVFGLPVVVNTYGLDLIYPSKLYQWMLRVFLPRCDHIFAISRATEEEALKRGASPNRTSIVHPGLDFSEFETVPDVDNIKQQYGLNGHLTLLNVGRLARRKGISEFVQHSLPTIVKRCPETIFLVAGDNPTHSLTHDEDIKAHIESQVRELGLEHHVQILGWIGYEERQELINLYHASDIFVLPAIQVPGDMEGFGVVLTEAAAAGKPTVASQLGGIPDAVADGRSGLLVEPEQWDQLSKTVVRLIEDKSLRRRIGQFGRERARNEFDWSVIGQKYLETLKKVIQP